MSTNASPARIYILSGVELLGLLALTIAASYLNATLFFGLSTLTG